MLRLWTDYAAARGLEQRDRLIEHYVPLVKQTAERLKGSISDDRAIGLLGEFVTAHDAMMVKYDASLAAFAASNGTGQAAADAMVKGQDRAPTDLIDQITVAAKEQAEGIEQVNRAVAEMDKVTQQTAATAEESASTASELNAQAEELTKASVSLLAIVEGKERGEPPPPRRGQLTWTGHRPPSLPPPAGKGKPVRPSRKASS